MSKICEKCGNMIPDGVDVCPNCGREDDSAIAAVMMISARPLQIWAYQSLKSPQKSR